MKKVLLACILGVFFVDTSMATICGSGFFLDDTGVCTECTDGYYCPGDDTKNLCPTHFQSGTGLTSIDQCRLYGVPGRAYIFSGGNVSYTDCPQNYYCPGGDLGKTFKDREIDTALLSPIGTILCDFGYTEMLGATSINDCISCPNIDWGAQWHNGEFMRLKVGLMGDDGAPSCIALSYFIGNPEQSTDEMLLILALLGLSGGELENNLNFTPGEIDGEHIIIASWVPEINDYQIVRMSLCPLGMMASPTGSPEQFFDSVTDATTNMCVPITDGMVCVPDDVVGMSCKYCSEIHPMLSRSDGVRMDFGNCYALSKPGYYISSALSPVSMDENQCAPGDYCPGGVMVHLGESGGNLACNTLPGDHEVSPVNATSVPGATKTTDCFVDMGGGGETEILTDETGTYTSSGGMCYYLE